MGVADEQFEILELLEVRYLAILQAGMHAALASVSDFWAGQGDDLTLPDVATWQGGNVPDDVLLSVVKTFPACTVEATRLDSINRPSMARASLWVTLYTMGKTPADANKLNHRYAAAARRVLRENKAPGVHEHLQPSVAVAETLFGTRSAYFKKSTIQQPLTVAVVL